MAKEPDNADQALAVEDRNQDGTPQFAELWRPAEEDSRPRGPERALLEKGRITLDQVERAAERLKENPRLGLLEALVQTKAVDAIEALQARAEYFRLPFAQVKAAEVDQDVFELLPAEYIKNKLVLPIRWDNEAILVGLSDPADIFLVDDVRRRIRKPLSFVVVPPGDILHTISELSTGPTQQVEDIIKDIAEDAVEVVDSKAEEVTDLEKIAGESPVIRYVNYLIASAVKDGVSDIHIEPVENHLRVRCRIDGVLFEQQAPPLQMHAAIISRLKIMANLNIAERRLPQDGRIRAAIRGKTVDLRVSTLPTVNGEKCVIRILDNRAITVGLENLGMADEALVGFRGEVLKPHGIVLVTGPTGSGKSTTLYSALQVMDAGRLNISTVEDPVEYELQTVNQVNVHESIGMSFSAVLRSLLRQDPDIIMVGEIRDEETARIAVQASLTGHLVLSTLHTNDAPSSITRLINIGIEPYLISAAVNAVLAQRLVRRICGDCKKPEPSLRASEQAFLSKAGAELLQASRGTGCEKCRHTGYKGRVGLFELFKLDDDLRDVVSRNPSLGEIRRASRAAGMRTLIQDGISKVADGQTTIEEIMRITET